MAMKRCPVCGEKYSDTYKSCPFCEEEAALQSGNQIRRTTPGRGGKRASRGRQPNLLSPILIVLIVIMLALLAYLLFGDRIADSLRGEADQQVEDVTPPDTAPSGGDDVTMPEDGDDVTIPEAGDDGTDDTQQTDPSALPETLTISYLGSPREEFTMSVGDDPIPLTASGGSGGYTWSSDDDGVASVDAEGRVTAVSAGQATLTVTDGTGKGTCVVIVRAGTSGGTTGSGGSQTTGTLRAGAAVVVNGGNGVFVRSGPGTSYEALATVPNGASVQIVGSAGDGWYEITFAGSGGVTTTGYMRGDFLANS